MLVDKAQTVEINDVVTIKLLSGEEIVGKLIDRTSDSVFLAKPIRITLEPISATQVGLSMLPVLGSVTDLLSVQFPLSGMAIRPIKTSGETRSKYLEITTGLVTPTTEQRSIIS